MLGDANGAVLDEHVGRVDDTGLLEAPARATAVDPICGMDVDIATARWTAEKDGQTYYFCAPGCRKTFLAAR